MAYSVRAGSERFDCLTAVQALERTRALLDDGSAKVLMYDVAGDPMNLRELVLAAMQEARAS